MLPEPWAGVRRILAVRPDNIGDVVMLGPALRALREALPATTITLLASPAGSQVAPLLPWIDDVITERVVWQDASGRLAQDPATRVDARADDPRARLRRSGHIHQLLAVTACGGLRLLSGRHSDARRDRRRSSAVQCSARPCGHCPTALTRPSGTCTWLEGAGIPVRNRQLEIRVPGWARAAADRMLREVGLEPEAPFLVLAPGASCPARRYDLNRFAEVARLLAADPGLPLVVVGHEREAALITPVLHAVPSAASLVGRTSVPELAAVVRRAQGPAWRTIRGPCTWATPSASRW